MVMNRQTGDHISVDLHGSLMRTTGQYYLHQFVPEQPDLNWDNPVVRKEVLI